MNLSRNDIRTIANDVLKHRSSKQALRDYFASQLPQFHIMETRKNYYEIAHRFQNDACSFHVGNGLASFTPDMIIAMYEQIGLTDEQILACQAQQNARIAELTKQLNALIELGIEGSNSDLLEIRDCAEEISRLLKKQKNIAEALARAEDPTS